MVGSKVCTKCKLEKPIPDYHKSKSGSYGVKPQCKKCVLDYTKKHYEPRRLEIKRKREEKKKLEQKEVGRVCTKCNTFKLFEFYSKDKAKKFGVDSKCKECCKKRCAKYRENNKYKCNLAIKKWYKKNKEKKAEYTKRYRKDNPERMKELRKATRIRCADRIKAYNKSKKRREREKLTSKIRRLKYSIVADAQKTYYCNMYGEYLTALFLSMKDYLIDIENIKLEEKNKKRIEYARNNYEKNKEKIIKYQKEYYNKNLHLEVAKSKRNKAKKIQRTPKWANNSVINDFYELRQFVSEVSGVEYHVDHIIPLQGKKVSGLHVAANLQVIKAKDNLRKNARFDPNKHEHRIINEQEVYACALKVP